MHIINQLASPTNISTIVGRYWARMAYVDIGHEKAKALYERQKREFNYANLDSLGGGKYRVKTARQPQYMGANIIPLKTTGTSVSVTVTTTAPYTATLAVKASNGAVRYVQVVNNKAQANLASGEEVSLVIANTPATIYLYDPFSLTSDVSRGLDYQIQLTGASA